MQNNLKKFTKYYYLGKQNVPVKSPAVRKIGSSSCYRSLNIELDRFLKSKRLIIVVKYNLVVSIQFLIDETLMTPFSIHRSPKNHLTNEK